MGTEAHHCEDPFLCRATFAIHRVAGDLAVTARRDKLSGQESAHSFTVDIEPARAGEFVLGEDKRVESETGHETDYNKLNGAPQTSPFGVLVGQDDQATRDEDLVGVKAIAVAG